MEYNTWSRYNTFDYMNDFAGYYCEMPWFFFFCNNQCNFVRSHVKHVVVDLILDIALLPNYILAKLSYLHF